MNIEEIKKNKPDGATHYALYEGIAVVYYKYVNCNLHVYCNIREDWRLDKVKKTSNFKKRLKPL